MVYPGGRVNVVAEEQVTVTYHTYLHVTQYASGVFSLHPTQGTDLLSKGKAPHYSGGNLEYMMKMSA